jgi:hypothetical protein
MKLKNPTSYVRFYTNIPSLVRGLHYIDEVLPFGTQPKDAIYLRYEDAMPPRVHLAEIIGDNLGLKVRSVRPDCVIDLGLVRRFRESWRLIPRPHIVVQRQASPWSPNKDWPEKYWIELIAMLSEQAAVIEIGSKISEQKIFSGSYIDLRGQTSLEELAAVIAAADVFVGPVSGPAHIAAAAGTPAVIIIGGYEHPINTHYTGNVSFYTALACSPCWLTEPCPYDLKCLKMIRPNTVANAVRKACENRKLVSFSD